MMVFTPLSTIFLLYREAQFYWRGKPENPEKTTDRVHLAMSGIRTHNFNGNRSLLYG
jgi:hypothetical protein